MSQRTISQQTQNPEEQVLSLPDFSAATPEEQVLSLPDFSAMAPEDQVAPLPPRRPWWRRRGGLLPSFS